MLASLRYPPSITVPLTLGEDGVVRITGTRVTLAVVLAVLGEGHSPEQVAADIFQDLTAADIHAVLAWVYRHTDEVHDYLASVNSRPGEKETPPRPKMAPPPKPATDGLDWLRNLTPDVD